MRLDVRANESPLTRKKFPFLLGLQSELRNGLDTTVVVPLGKPAVVEGKLAQTLTPLLDIDGVAYAMCTPEIAAVATTRLKKTRRKYRSAAHQDRPRGEFSF